MVRHWTTNPLRTCSVSSFTALLSSARFVRSGSRPLTSGAGSSRYEENFQASDVASSKEAELRFNVSSLCPEHVAVGATAPAHDFESDLSERSTIENDGLVEVARQIDEQKTAVFAAIGISHYGCALWLWPT